MLQGWSKFKDLGVATMHRVRMNWGHPHFAAFVCVAPGHYVFAVFHNRQSKLEGLGFRVRGEGGGLRSRQAWDA